MGMKLEPLAKNGYTWSRRRHKTEMYIVFKCWAEKAHSLTGCHYLEIEGKTISFIIHYH